MSKKMLIDATHEEETRVAVVEGNRLIEFDYESKVRKQIKGNIFLAKVTRVEPSLQAAFVNFGGNRHGFLPFSEIHPDYYRIPIADRERLIAQQAEEISAMKQKQEEDEEDDLHVEDLDETEAAHDEVSDDEDEIEEIGGEDAHFDPADPNEENPEAVEISDDEKAEEEAPEAAEDEDSENKKHRKEYGGRNKNKRYKNNRRKYASHRNRGVEVVGGDDIETEQPRRFNYRRHYKIQEVVKRGQIMLVQVSKEERGNKGAAVTTYLSLPGRYCVLMPNSPHGGGISRKIASFKDRRHMKEILNELNVPDGMSVILRTAGVERTKAEIKRDFDYLMRLWNDIRELTLKSSAPALINEEGNLVKRSIRDIYTRDVDEIIISGSEGYKNAKKFMKLLIPSHAKRVKEYKEDRLPLFQRYQVESQINEIGEPSVTLKSGGYIVINPTEALVSIDVNSGRATKERHIEETALKTNLEAADEVARQLRLRDLGGLVVIDFIDMEDRRNNAKVERRTKEALSKDRARIQVGRISSFGLLELSRQRMNPSLTESQFHRCPHCQGVGFVRTLDGTAISAIRAIEEIGTHGRHSEVLLRISSDVALYILNHKRSTLAGIEERYDFKVVVQTDESVAPGKYIVEPLTLRQSDSPRQEEPEQADRIEDNKPLEEAESDEDNSQEQRKNTRKRGRRGGRRRNKPETANREQTQGEQEQEEKKEQAAPVLEKAVEIKETVENTDEKSEETEKGKKPARKPGRKPKKKSEEAPQEEVPQEGAPQEDEARKTRRTRRSPKKDMSKSTDNNKQKSENVSSSPEEKEHVHTPEPQEVPPQPQRNVEYEVVSQPVEQKKKGWWNKLIEQ